MQKMQKSRLKVFEGLTEGLSSSPSEILETLELVYTRGLYIYQFIWIWIQLRLF